MEKVVLVKAGLELVVTDDTLLERYGSMSEEADS